MKEKNESNLNFNVEIEQEPVRYIPVESIVGQKEDQSDARAIRSESKSKDLISCLRNEKVIVKYAVKPNSNITDPKHALYGGMAETASRVFTVQMLRNGNLTNVLTDDEKDFLEDYMGLEKNALSVHLRKDNYWKNYQVRLTKSDTILDLSTVEDFIKYKVLLTNSSVICPSLEMFTDPKGRNTTYQYYIVGAEDDVKQTNKNMSVKMESMLELGKIQDKKNILKIVVEMMSGKKVSKESKLEFIQSSAFKEIESNPKLFLSIVKDPYFPTKILISECLEYGILSTRSGLYYVTSNSEPLCGAGEESTLVVASKYLNLPKKQELKLSLEAKLKIKKEE